MPISDKLIGQLLQCGTSREDILGEDGLLKELTRKVDERALEAEMEAYLGYTKHDQAGLATPEMVRAVNRCAVFTAILTWIYPETVTALLNQSWSRKARNSSTDLMSASSRSTPRA